MNFNTFSIFSVVKSSEAQTIQQRASFFLVLLLSWYFRLRYVYYNNNAILCTQKIGWNGKQLKTFLIKYRTKKECKEDREPFSWLKHPFQYCHPIFITHILFPKIFYVSSKHIIMYKSVCTSTTRTRKNSTYYKKRRVEGIQEKCTQKNVNKYSPLFAFSN